MDASWHDSGLDHTAIGWARSTWGNLAPSATGGLYVNFAGLDDDTDMHHRAFGASAGTPGRGASLLRPDSLFAAAAHKP